MSHIDHNTNMDKSKDLHEENERRVDHLINLVEKHTRTERHLEQHSDIASPEQIQHAEKVQAEREQQIENLKNAVAYGKHSNDDELDNVKERYRYTEGYLQHNADHMESHTLEKTKEKQEHRKEQIDFLE